MGELIMRENKVQLDKRQKFVLVLTVLAFAFLVWQIYGLVRGDVVPASDNSSKSTSSNTQQLSQNVNSPVTAYHQNTPKEAELSAAAPNSMNLAPEQQQYMQISSQYELAKLQRRLLEEQVAMSDARNRIADTENRTNQLSSANAGASALGGGAALYTNGDPYRLSYLSQQGDLWNATIVVNGEFKNVAVGDTLFDGSKITAVDQQGVTLLKGDQKLRLTFGGVKPITASQPTSTTVSKEQSAAS